MFIDAYLANVTVFGGTFAPLGWAFCDGSLQSIAANNALYALIGTIYGGDGQTTFALPDLRSRIAIHPGQAPGMQNYLLGQAGGNESVTLVTSQLAPHSHAVSTFSGNPGASTTTGSTDIPGATAVPAQVNGIAAAYTTTPSAANMGAYNLPTSTPASGGGGLPINVVSPVLAMNYIICVEGIFPSRN